LAEPGVYSQSDVLSSFNDILEPIGFPPLPQGLGRDILVCIMSLLQDVRFVDDQGIDVGNLFFAISKTRVGLIGRIQLFDGRNAWVTVLSTENHYHPFEPKTAQDIGVAPNTALTVVRRSGLLRFESM
jgi:hypothetical protein